MIIINIRINNLNSKFITIAEPIRELSHQVLHFWAPQLSSMVQLDVLRYRKKSDPPTYSMLSLLWLQLIDF